MLLTPEGDKVSMLNLVQVRLGIEVLYVPQVQPDWGSTSWPLYHNSTFHVTRTSALTTWSSLLTHIHPHKPLRKIKFKMKSLVICNQQVDSSLYIDCGLDS